MKKKSLLVLMLAMASTAALGLTACGEEHEEHAYSLVKSDANFHWKECECGEKSEYAIHADANHDGKCDLEGCGQDVHVHAFTTKSDADKHWQECVYGETANVGRHIDEDKNGKCDVCDTEFVSEDGIAKVIFVMLGNGEAPATQKIEIGEKATAPEAPVAQGYIFGGWYADDRFDTEFDFDAAITEDVLVYAKWTEDTTAGQSVKYAAELELEGEQLTPFGAYNKLYFKYTATAAGRYELRLQQGAASQKCSFVTNLGETSYSADATYYFDLAAGQELIVTVTRGEDVTDTQGVGVYIAKTITEPLPESWASGTYTDGNYFVTISEDKRTVSFRESGEDGTNVSFNYIGGEKNALTLSYKDRTYVMSPMEGGTYKLTLSSTVYVLTYVEDAENRIPVSAFAGTYTPADGKFNMIDEIGIYENGNGYYRVGTTPKNIQTIGVNGCVYLTDINTLVYSGFTMTLNVDENGEAESINIIYTNNGQIEKYVYNRTGEAPDTAPARLPIEENTEYYGHTYRITDTGYYQNWGGSGYLVNIDGYVSATDTYTIVVGRDSTVYQIKIENLGADPEDDERTMYAIKLYDATGETLVDTLTEFRPLENLDELPDATTQSSLNLVLTDFQKSYHFYEVKTSGWYKFTFDTEKVYIRANITTDKVDANSPGVLVADLGTDNVVYLEAGTLVCAELRNKNVDEGNRTFSVQNVGEAGAPVGRYESNPIAIDGLGLSDTTVLPLTAYYYEVSLPVGKYLVSVRSGGSYYVKYELDGTEHDYTEETSTRALYTAFEVTDANTPVKLKVYSTSSYNATLGNKILLEEDYTDSTVLTFDAENKGTGKLTQSGAYCYADLAGDFAVSNGLTIGSNEEDAQEFTIWQNGESKTVKRVSLSSAALAHGFKIELADGQEVDYYVYFLEGAQQNPFKAEGAGRHNFPFQDNTVTAKWIEYTAPEDEDRVISLSSSVKRAVYFEINGVKYGYDKEGNVQAGGLTYEIAAGAKVTIKLGVDDEKNTYGGSFTLLVNYNFKNAEALEMQVGVATEDKARANYAVVSIAAGESLFYTIADTAGSAVQVSSYAPFKLVDEDTTVYEVEGANGIYTATIPAGKNICFRLTSETAQNVTFVIPYPLGSLGNPHVVSVEKGTYTSATVPTNATVYFTFTEGTYVATRTMYRVHSTTLAANTPFDVTEGEVLYVTGLAEGTFTISPRVSADFVGKYTAGDTTIAVSQSAATIGKKTYTISKVVEGVYTFASGEEEIELSFSVTANNDPVLTYNDADYEYIYMFTEEMAQTYTGTGSDNYGWNTFTYSLTFNQKGQGTFTARGSSININQAVLISEGKGTYSFAYNRGTNPGTATFKFGAGGVISITFSDYFAETTFDPTTPFEYDPSANDPKLADFPIGAIQTFTGTGKFMGEMDVELTLTLNDDGTGTYARLGGGYTGKIMMLQGEYSFKDDGNDVTFTFDEDGKILLSDSRYGKTAIALTPATEYDPAVFHMLTRDQAGTYKGTGTVWGSANTPVTVSFDRDGAGRIQFVIKNMGNEQIDEEIQLVPKNGKYQFNYFNGNATLTIEFNLDDTVTITGGNFPGVKLSHVAAFTAKEAGAYTGTGTFLGSTANITLTLNADGTGSLGYTGTAYGSPFDISNDFEVYKDGSGYKFVYDGNNATFTFDENGIITMDTDNVGTGITLMKPIFTEDQAGWYAGTGTMYGMDAPLKLSFDIYGQGKFSYFANSEDVLITCSDGVYSFKYNYSSYDGSFTFNDDGTLLLTTTNMGEDVVMTAYVPQYNTVTAGNYTGVDGNGITYWLIVNDDLETVKYIIADPDSPTNEDCTLSLSDGTYSFTYFYDMFTATFTVDDYGNIMLQDAGMTITLEPTTEEPDIGGGGDIDLEEATYVGEMVYGDVSYTVTLSVYSDGTADYEYAEIAENEDEGGYSETYSWLTISASGNGYTFTYGEGDFVTVVTFTIDGNSCTVTDEYFGTFTLNKMER